MVSTDTINTENNFNLQKYFYCKAKCNYKIQKQKVKLIKIICFSVNLVYKTESSFKNYFDFSLLKFIILQTHFLTIEEWKSLQQVKVRLMWQS